MLVKQRRKTPTVDVCQSTEPGQVLSGRGVRQPYIYLIAIAWCCRQPWIKSLCVLLSQLPYDSWVKGNRPRASEYCSNPVVACLRSDKSDLFSRAGIKPKLEFLRRSFCYKFHKLGSQRMEQSLQREYMSNVKSVRIGDWRVTPWFIFL